MYSQTLVAAVKIPSIYLLALDSAVSQRHNHLNGTRGTHPLHLWRSWGPSVFGSHQLLRPSVR